MAVGDNGESALFRRMMPMVEDQWYHRRAVQAAYDYSRDKTWHRCAQQYVEFIEQVLSDTPHRTY